MTRLKTLLLAINIERLRRKELAAGSLQSCLDARERRIEARSEARYDSDDGDRDAGRD